MTHLIFYLFLVEIITDVAIATPAWLDTRLVSRSAVLDRSEQWAENVFGDRENVNISGC